MVNWYIKMSNDDKLDLEESPSVWVRPFRQLLIEGKPGTNSLLLAAPSPSDGSPLLFGVISSTPGKRLLFYPYMKEQVPVTHSDGSKSPVDHITIERTRGSWERIHQTYFLPSGKRAHKNLGWKAGVVPNKGLVFWLGIALRWSDLQSEERLISVRFKSHPNDLDRRTSELTRHVEQLQVTL